MTTIKTPKKLIEVALPLDDINAACAYEKMPGIGAHPRGIHLWWARRPLAAARAVLFAQMVNDPGGERGWYKGKTKAQADAEREELFDVIRELVKWENTTNEAVLERAREAIRRSWRETCELNRDHSQAAELFDPDKLPAFHDPFAGGGAIPLEAQRLGLEAHASDLNPVAVLINKAMIEIPPRFAGQRPVGPVPHDEKQPRLDQDWPGASGLAEDVRRYGRWMRDEAEKRIGHLYPKVEVTAEMAKDRPDLKPYVGRKLTVIAWIWARTVKSPNPAFAHVDVPLASTFMLSTKTGKEAYVEPIIQGDGYRFVVNLGKPKEPEAAKAGTKLSRGSFRCLMSGSPIAGDYIKCEGKAGRMGTRLMAIVAQGERARVYLAPTPDHEVAGRDARPKWRPEVEFFQQALGFRVGNYGMTKWCDLFTDRQVVALTEFSDLIGEAMQRVRHDALAAGMEDDGKMLRESGESATAYSEAVAVCLALAVDRCADFSNAVTRWVPGNEKVMNLFGRQAIAMTWDFPEAAVLQDAVGGLAPVAAFVGSCIAKLPHAGVGQAVQRDAMSNTGLGLNILSTDPPYYDNVGYGDLSDFFYVWLRRSLRSVYPAHRREPPTTGGSPVAPGPGPTPATSSPPKRFYGTVTLDPVKAKMDFAQIVDEVVQHFTARVGSNVSINVEIQSSDADGFDDTLRRVVRENCGVLKFGTAEFEE